MIESTGQRIATARVARIPYLNAIPYYIHWDELATRTGGQWTSTEMPPRQVGISMENGDVDAGLMAVADLVRLDATFEPLVLGSGSSKKSLGIANRDRVDSVLLFVRVGQDEEAQAAGSSLNVSPGATSGMPGALSGDARIPSPTKGKPWSPDFPLALNSSASSQLDGCTIAVTGESSTSYRLLRLLLEGRHGIHPSRYERTNLNLGENASGIGSLAHDIQGALVIGDAALEWRKSPPAGWREAMDLVHEWSLWQDLPFVFARWAARRELPLEEKASLASFLGNALKAGVSCLSDPIQHLPARLGSADELEFYLRNFIYELGPDEDRAESRFRQLLRDHNIVCTAQ